MREMEMIFTLPQPAHILHRDDIRLIDVGGNRVGMGDDALR